MKGLIERYDDFGIANYIFLILCIFVVIWC